MAIKINPKNKGKFTQYAKGKGQRVQQAAQAVKKNPRASTKLKREAQFAINAKNFNHKKKG